MIAHAQKFNYKIIEVLPLSSLEEYKEHRRLQVFYFKGCKCVNCGLEGTQLAVGMDKHGFKHIDVYTDDFYPLTVDHILPKSKGGDNGLDNLQPMCFACNNNKKSNEKTMFPYQKPALNNAKSVVITDNIPTGKVLYKRRNLSPIGTFKSFEPNPNFKNRISVTTFENPGSYYDPKNLVYES